MLGYLPNNFVEMDQDRPGPGHQGAAMVMAVTVVGAEDSARLKPKAYTAVADSLGILFAFGAVWVGGARVHAMIVDEELLLVELIVECGFGFGCCTQTKNNTNVIPKPGLRSDSIHTVAKTSSLLRCPTSLSMQ